MTRAVKILIVDPDRYFAAGLQHAVHKHFNAKGVPVIFMNRPLSYPLADLIFWAPGYSTTVMPMGLLAGRSHKSHLVLLMSEQATHLLTNCVPWVFYRHQSRGHLLTLIEQVIHSSTGEPIAAVNDKQRRRTLNALSPRQREVIRCISKGMQVRAISERLQIHEKTVSNHKRTAMRKLQLSRTTDLHHWLLCNPITDTPF